MNMIVCCKQIFDPEEPPEKYIIDEKNNEIRVPHDFTRVISPFDLNAVEAALQVKDKLGGKVTIIVLGKDLLSDVVKKPIAMGADELILLQDENFENGDSWTTANYLAGAIRKIGDYKIIFCGRQAADFDNGQIGLGIAELLNIPAVNLIRNVEVKDDKAYLERVITDGYQKMSVNLPALMTVSNEIGQPRYAKLPGIMAASKVQPIIWNAQDIAYSSKSENKIEKKSQLLNLFKPVRDKDCVLIEAKNDEDVGVLLANKLREDKII